MPPKQAVIATATAIALMIAHPVFSQVMFTNAAHGVFAIGPGYARLDERTTVTAEAGYAEDFRAGVSGFVGSTKVGASSITTYGIGIETGILRAGQVLPVGLIGGLGLAKSTAGETSTNNGVISFGVYAERGDSAATWYPAVTGSLNVGTETFASASIASDFLLRLGPGIALLAEPQVSFSKYGTTLGIGAALAVYL